MFAFGQEQAPAKTEASKKKPHRRVSLANRSLSSHRNEENMVPAPSTPRGHKRRASIVGKGAPLPGQQAFLQVCVWSNTTDARTLFATGRVLPENGVVHCWAFWCVPVVRFCISRSRTHFYVCRREEKRHLLAYIEGAKCKGIQQYSGSCCVE